tara:strand:+ start:2859 stop:3185 length:327 start_codon:yes stop_codon:yes gene_type:complete
MIKKKIPFPFIDIYFFKWNHIKKTEIHDHARNGCFIFLLKGKLKENIYDHNIQLIKSKLYNPFSISYINDNIGYHSIEPLKNSYSIHFYHPKNYKTKYYKTKYYINNK